MRNAARIAACVFSLTFIDVNAVEYFVNKPHSEWWHTTVKYDVPDMRPVWFGGTLKCENAFPPTRAWMAQEFGVSVVLKYADGKEDWLPLAKWTPGTHDWQDAQNVIFPKKPVAAATLRVCANPGPGVASYRNIFVRREDPGLTVSTWRRITDRPFSDKDWLYVTFPRVYSWSSDSGGGLKASGRGREAYVPVPHGAGEVKFALECDGRKSETVVPFSASGITGSQVPRGKVRIWTEDSAKAVTPLTFPSKESRGDIQLVAARRGAASVQVLVTAGKDVYLDGVTLEIPRLAMANGEKLKGRVKWERVSYVRRHPDAVIHPLAPDREIRWLADPLLPAAPMKVRPDSTQGAWVTVFAASNAVPGKYTGTILVKAGQSTIGRVPLAFVVLPVSLPKYFGCPQIHALWESHILALYKERGREMLERAWDICFDHRINPDGCGVRWYEPIPVETLKKWRERGMSMTAGPAINVRAKSPDQMWVPDPTVEQTLDPKFYEDIRDRLRPYAEEVRKNGLAGCIYTYGFDERQDEQFAGIAAFWRRYKADFPDIPLMTTAFMYRRRAEGREVKDWTATDWHCPAMNFWKKNLTEELHGLGKKAWWYICCGPVYPRLNVGIEHPPVEARLLAWQQYSDNCDGVFNWGINYWHRRSLTDDSDVYFSDWHYGQGMGGMTGDGLMIYPGKNGPVTSIRLANVRDGVQDYELIKLAEAKIGKDAVLKLVKGIAPDQEHIVRDAEAIRKAAADIAKLAAQK